MATHRRAAARPAPTPQRCATLRTSVGASGASGGQELDAIIVEGIRVLGALADGAETREAISALLDLSDDTVRSHLAALTRGRFVQRRGDRFALAARARSLLGALADRTDLLAIAAPIVLEAESRLGVRIDVEVPEEADPSAVRGPSPFAVVTGADGGRELVACALDTAGQIACVLRIVVGGAAPEAIGPLGVQLATVAEAISARLPQRKSR